MQKSGNCLGLGLPGTVLQNRMKKGLSPRTIRQLRIIPRLNTQTNFVSKNENGLAHDDLKVETNPNCKFLFSSLGFVIYLLQDRIDRFQLFSMCSWDRFLFDSWSSRRVYKLVCWILALWLNQFIVNSYLTDSLPFTLLTFSNDLTENNFRSRSTVIFILFKWKDARNSKQLKHPKARRI